MKVVVGEILPLALVVTISPINVIPVILLGFTKRPLATSACFLAGFVAGVAALLVAAVALAEAVDLSCELRPFDLGRLSSNLPWGHTSLSQR